MNRQETSNLKNALDQLTKQKEQGKLLPCEVCNKTMRGKPGEKYAVHKACAQSVYIEDKNE